MSWKDITEGDKTARPYAARFIKAKTGTMGIEVAFKFKQFSAERQVESEESLNWVGWLSAGAIDNTMKTLVEVLGFNGNDAVDANGLLTDPKALNWEGDIKLVVEMETNPENGNSYPKVKWVNALGGSAFAALAPEIVKNELNAVGFKAAFLAVKQAGPRQPAQKPNETSRQPQAGFGQPQGGFSTDGIPF